MGLINQQPNPFQMDITKNPTLELLLPPFPCPQILQRFLTVQILIIRHKAQINPLVPILPKIQANPNPPHLKKITNIPNQLQTENKEKDLLD